MKSRLRRHRERAFLCRQHAQWLFGDAKAMQPGSTIEGVIAWRYLAFDIVPTAFEYGRFRARPSLRVLKSGGKPPHSKKRSILQLESERGRQFDLRVAGGRVFVLLRNPHCLWPFDAIIPGHMPTFKRRGSAVKPWSTFRIRSVCPCQPSGPDQESSRHELDLGAFKGLSLLPLPPFLFTRTIADGDGDAPGAEGLPLLDPGRRFPPHAQFAFGGLIGEFGPSS